MMKVKKEDKEKEMTRILCSWNRKDITADVALDRLWMLYEKEVLETWNDPLEKLLTRKENN
jgi:hypothetical protein